MITATLTVMALRLRRDVPALLLVFALPVIVFLVFTTVFRETSTQVPRMSVALLDTAGTPGSRQAAAALARDGIVLRNGADSEGDLRARVAVGAIDVGVLLRPGGQTGVAAELVVIGGRTAAAQIVGARLAEAGPGDMRRLDSAGTPAITTIEPLHGDPVVLEEAGAIAAMFLMIAAIQVAATLVDERRSGIHERVACSGDVAALVMGKLAFGAIMGTLQAGLIVTTAAVVFGVDVLTRPACLALTCVLTATMATSLALVIAACCSTRHQAQTISTFAILISSAVGGSMVPMKLMPANLAQVGRFMPNAWSIGAFNAAFGIGHDVPQLPYAAWAGLAGASVIATMVATLSFRRSPLL